MKRLLPILLLGAASLFFSSASGQNTILRTDNPRHDFGTIAEDGGKVEHTFSCINTLSKPVVILDITGGCSCTEAKYSRQPILPGKATDIKILFDPMNQPEGRFTRKVVITTSDGRSVLTITGDITPRTKSIEEQYPLILGNGIRIESNHHAFGYVEHSEAIGSSIGIINTSDREVNLLLIPSQESGELTLNYPHTLKPNESSAINFGYNIASSSKKYGTLNDILSIDINGKRSKYPLIINGIAIDRRENNTDKEWQKIQLSENFIKFGTLKYSSAEAVRTLAIRNIGLEPLTIRHIECSNPAFEVKIKGSYTIPSDSETTLEVRIKPSKCDFGATTAQVMIITNDPQQPATRLRVTAIVEN